MAGLTNAGKAAILGTIFRGVTPPTNFFIALCTNATPPTQDINTLGQLTQIATGNGYAVNGISLNRNATDFDVLTEDDTLDKALIQLRDIVWTATGGPLPATGNGARWAILTDDNATPASRVVWAYWDLVSDRTVSVGQTLTIQNAELDILEV